MSNTASESTKNPAAARNFTRRPRKVKMKKEKLVQIPCFNSGKNGYFVYNYRKPKKDNESIGRDGLGID